MFIEYQDDGYETHFRICEHDSTQECDEKGCISVVKCKRWTQSGVYRRFDCWYKVASVFVDLDKNESILVQQGNSKCVPKDYHMDDMDNRGFLITKHKCYFDDELFYLNS